MAYDFAEILDATEEITVELKGKPIVCAVYVSGYERIPHEDQVRLAELSDSALPAQQRLAEIAAELNQLNGDQPERKEKLHKELIPLQREHRQNSILMARELVPCAIKEWKFDGEPFTYHGECPPTKGNCLRLPDEFIMEVAARAGDVWDAHQKKDLKQSGSEPPGEEVSTLVEPQAPNTTP